MNPEQLQSICTTQAGKQRALSFVDPLNKYMPAFGIVTPAEVADFIAQLMHESGEFRYMQELADGSAYDQRADLGNTRPEAIAIAKKHNTTPGRWFKGHGPIQITGYDLHLQCSRALFGDDMLLDNPLILTQADTGTRSACWFWKMKGLNAFADAGDFVGETKRINGGTNGLADRQAYRARARNALGVK